MKYICPVHIEANKFQTLLENKRSAFVDA